MDEPVVPTRVADAAATLRETAAHYRALDQLGIEAQAPSDLITAAWEFLGVVMKHSEDDNGRPSNGMLDALMRNAQGPVAVQVKRSHDTPCEAAPDTGQWIMFPTMTDHGSAHYAFRLAKPADVDVEHLCSAAGRGSYENIARAVKTAMRKYVSDEQSSRTPTVRNTVTEVIEPGEEVDVATVYGRVVDRGMETSTSVISNELSRWSRAGVLQRVRRGVYARPEEPALPDLHPATDLPPDVSQEGDVDASQSAGAATV